MKKMFATVLLIFMAFMCFSVTGCSEHRNSNESSVVEEPVTEETTTAINITTTKLVEKPSIVALEATMRENSVVKTTTETVKSLTTNSNTTTSKILSSTSGAYKLVSSTVATSQTSAATSAKQTTSTSYQPVETTYIENTPVYTGEKISYIVKAGDTLSALAERYHTTVVSIMETNELPSEDFIREGQSLNIPVNNSYEYVYEEYNDDTVNYDSGYVDQNSGGLVSCSVTRYTTCSEWSSWENIMMAADRINEIGCIGPWGDFNWFRDIGTCDSDPWKPASVYIGNEVGIDYGGGICFPSTVLMLAEEECGMETWEKHPHAREVSYNPRPLRENYASDWEYQEALSIALSREAAIDSSGLNLRFGNPTAQTVYIHVDVNTWASSVTVTMTVAQ